GEVLFGSYDRRLRCFDAVKGGEPKWEFEADAQIHCSPAIYEERFAVIAGCDSQLRLIDLASGEETMNVPTDDACAASAAIFDDHAYLGNLRGDFMSVSLKTGKPEWQLPCDDKEHPLGSISASPVVTPDAVFFATQDNKLIRVDRQTGKFEWTYTTRGGIESS